MTAIKCNYFKKIGCEALSHDQNATKSYWISHAGSGLIHVYCCPECSKIVEKTDKLFGSSVIANHQN
jgi:hypothetical protein